MNTVKFVAYHGSQNDNLKPDLNRAFYLTDDYELSKEFAYREVYSDGLYDEEIPCVYRFEGEFKNPYFMTLDEYDNEGQDSNIDYEKWVKMGVDGIVLKGNTTYYIVIDLNTIKMTGKKILPFNDDGYDITRADNAEDNNFDYKYPTIDEQIEEVLKIANKI